MGIGSGLRPCSRVTRRICSSCQIRRLRNAVRLCACVNGAGAILFRRLANLYQQEKKGRKKGKGPGASRKTVCARPRGTKANMLENALLAPQSPLQPGGVGREPVQLAQVSIHITEVLVPALLQGKSSGSAADREERRGQGAPRSQTAGGSVRRRCLRTAP